MSKVDEFRKRIGIKNVYFSLEMEKALNKYGFNTEITPLLYRDGTIGIIVNYTKKRKISVPPFLFPFYGTYLDPGFLSKHPEKATDIIKEATKLQRNRYIFSLFSLPPEITDIRPFTINGWKEKVKYTYRIYRGELTLKSSKKRKLKGINERNFTILKVDNPNNLYEMIQKMNRLKNRFTPYSSEYIRFIFDSLPVPSRTIYEIYDKNNVCLSSAMILRDLSCSYLFANAIHETIRKNNINLYFLNSLIEDELKISPCFDLQGANTPSLVKFKENFNGHLTPYFHIKTGIDITAVIKIKGRIRKWLMR